MLAGGNRRARMPDTDGRIAVASTITSILPDVALAPSSVNVVAAIRSLSQPTVRQASRAHRDRVDE